MTEDQLDKTTESLATIAGAFDRGLECDCPIDHPASLPGVDYANIPSALIGLCDMAKRIATAITPEVVAGSDETGGHIESLTEAAMGITAGLCKIASSIDSLADAMREVAEAVGAKP